MKCLECGTESDGAYCPSCGRPLRSARCKRCDATLPRGARYCTTCGAATRPWAAGVLPWTVTAVALTALLATLLIGGLGDGDDRAAVVSTAAPMTGDGATDAAPGPLTGTPREQADRLFNRIMQEREGGDTARAAFFLPMAIQAYGMAEPLDADGVYHLGLLHVQAGDAGAARDAANRLLRDAPNHLFGHLIAAQAAAAAGDDSAAREHYRKLLDAYDAESGQQRQEYLDHARILPEYREEARTFLAR